MHSIYFNAKQTPPYAPQKQKIKLSKQIIVLFSLFLFGCVISGVFYFKIEGISQFSQLYFKEYLSVLNLNYVNLCSNMFFSSLISYLVVLFLAYSVLGFILMYPLIIFKGIFFGGIICYTIKANGTNGMLEYIIKVFPWQIVSSLLLIWFVYASANSSIILFKNNILNIKSINSFNNLNLVYKFLALSFITIFLCIVTNIGILFEKTI